MPINTYAPGAKRGATGFTIYGPGGAGKTTIAGTMPGRGLLIDIPQVEGGDFVLEDKADRISVTAVTEWDEIDPLYWALAKRDESQLKGVSKLEWVAIDTITAMQELAKRKVIKERDLKSDPHKVSLPEYGMMGELVGEMVYRFRTLPLPTIWLAQQRVHGGRDDDPGPAQIGPDIIPSALRKLMPSMTLTGYLEVKLDENNQAYRTLKVGPAGGSHIVKARLLPGKRLPNVILNPDLGAIVAYMFGDGRRPKRAPDDSGLVVV